MGLLYMPDNAKQALRTHYRAKVVAAGPDASKQFMGLVGAIIHVSQSWGQPFDLNGKKHWMGRLRDVNGVFKGNSLQAVGDRVLCQRVDEVREKGGIFIPDAAMNKDVEALVISVGEKVDTVKPGDRALIARYVFAEIRIGTEKFILINESNINGVICG